MTVCLHIFLCRIPEKPKKSLISISLCLSLKLADMFLLPFHWKRGGLNLLKLYAKLAYIHGSNIQYNKKHRATAILIFFIVSRWMRFYGVMTLINTATEQIFIALFLGPYLGVVKLFWFKKLFLYLSVAKHRCTSYPKCF